MNNQSLTALGLSRSPFSKEIPDADLWMPSSRQTVVDDLVEAVESRQSALLRIPMIWDTRSESSGTPSERSDAGAVVQYSTTRCWTSRSSSSG